MTYDENVSKTSNLIKEALNNNKIFETQSNLMLEFDQSKDKNIATCGRHVSMWFCFFKKLGGDLKGFKRMIDKERKAQKKTADELVTDVVKI